jgi:integrase
VSNLMPQPWKHPRLGTYYFRKIVPPHLRESVGRLKGRQALTEIRIPLKTKDAREAKLRYPGAAAEADRLLLQAADGQVRLSHQQVIALAGLWYVRELKAHEAEPGDAEVHDTNLYHLELAMDDGAGIRRGEVAKIIAEDVDSILQQEGLLIDAASRADLEERIFWNKVALLNTFKRFADGDYRPDPKLKTFPQWQGVAATPIKAPMEGPTVTTLYALMAKERSHARKTAYSWPRILAKLTDYVGTEDAGKITDTDIIGWKDSLVASDLAPKTIANHLVVVKSFFRWAKVNKHIQSNPATDVEYKPKRDLSKNKRSYTDEEARLILLAARSEKKAHKRLAPWIAAFTGARIDEICGSMVSDVMQQEGIRVLRIDPAYREEGASVKNPESVRVVPVHPAIIAEGFLDYVKTLPADGPLFPKIKPDRFGKRGGNGSKTIGRWVRNGLGIKDSRVQPNHAWRHRFADECRKVGIPREVRFALDGHKLTDVGDEYGGAITGEAGDPQSCRIDLNAGSVVSYRTFKTKTVAEQCPHCRRHVETQVALGNWRA